MKKGLVLNIIIYSLFIVVVGILGYNCYNLKSELEKGPEIVWKEYRTTKYVEVPVEKIVYKTKTVYKNNGLNVNYDKNDDGLIISIGE